MSIAPEPSSLALHKVVFQKMERALLKLCSGQDAESVHGFRTSTRRLQTLLEQVIPDRDRSQKKLVKMLDRIRRRAGKVRDLDVQLAALRSLKVPQEPRRKTQLMQSLIELRAKHEKQLRKLLTKERMREIRKRLKRASRAVNLEPGRGDTLGATLGGSLNAARKMLAGVVHPAGPVTEDLLHRYRIVVKRARYTAEFAPKSAEAAQFIAQLRRLQDAIGHWHDWLILTQTAANRIGDVNQSTLVAALHNVTRGKFRQAVAALSASRPIQNAVRPVAVASGTSSEHSGKRSATSPTKAKRIETAA